MVGALVGFLIVAPLMQNGQPAVVLNDDGGTLAFRAVANDVLWLRFTPDGVKDAPTEMLNPKSTLRKANSVGSAEGDEWTTDALRAMTTPNELLIRWADGGTALTVERGDLANGILDIKHAAGENLYGMRGYGLGDNGRLPRSNGLFRNAGAHVAASAQGDGGAPLAYTTHWGVLIDSIDGDFANEDGTLEFSHDSRKSVEAYIVLGPPKRTLKVATLLTGNSPMPPKWALGFMNSQWKTTEDEVKSIVATYRQKQIPIDAFIMDFDFKAWGEDNFGEFRWNSQNNPGNYEPDKYLDGQSGLFGKEMAAQGIHLVGIMKPRVIVENADHTPTKQAMEANANGWWLHSKPYTDYFSHRLANDFDFSKPEVRKFYWEHAKDLFDTGISGWWNDEADDGFPSLGFFHMQESLYEGQRSVSNRRVWSLNRNFYLGAQRMAFGTWSGDIGTGFDVMRDQEVRMLAMLDLDQPMWSMDTGGFGGHPTPENYTRWMEFSSVVPIMRVHNTYGEHRQPWLYGPVAEAAATKAIRWRYAMFPSLYSWQHDAYLTGLGIARPLFWEFPDDPGSANVTDSWMLGDSILVSPVNQEGQTKKSIYLPPGRWISFPLAVMVRAPEEEGGTGMAVPETIDGGATIDVTTDATTWSDLPMFVRSGSILASQPVLQYMAEKPITQITLDVWPDASHAAKFTVYDDDGETYAYEHGAFFAQAVSATQSGTVTTISFERPKGAYRTAIRSYRVRVHGSASGTATLNGRELPVTPAQGGIQVTVPAGTAGKLIVK